MGFRKAAKDLQALKKIQKSKGAAHDSSVFIIAKLQMHVDLLAVFPFQLVLRSKAAHVLEQRKSSTGRVERRIGNERQVPSAQT